MKQWTSNTAANTKCGDVSASSWGFYFMLWAVGSLETILSALLFFKLINSHHEINSVDENISETEINLNVALF